jgi:flagellar biosynthesis protein
MRNEEARRTAAVALTRHHPQQAPVVIAKGYGMVAEAILQRAREHGLFVHTSPGLMDLLMHVDLDQHIPPQLYQAVAEVLAWVHGLEQDAASPPSG